MGRKKKEVTVLAQPVDEPTITINLDTLKPLETPVAPTQTPKKKWVLSKEGWDLV